MDLETFDPMITERSEWLVKNKPAFFVKVLPLFSQLTPSESAEILDHFTEKEVDYFEVAHYENDDDNSPLSVPSAILVFDDGKIYFDILDIENKDRLLSKFSNYVGHTAKFVNSRPITKIELIKRLETLSEMEDDEDIEDNDDFDDSEENEISDLLLYSQNNNKPKNQATTQSVAKDEYNVLDRSAFCLIAKQAALDWVIENEKNEPNDVIQMGLMNWSLDKINEEPSVFLLPSEIELLSKADQDKIWKKAKKRAFEEFLSSFCNDEKFWPKNINEKLFDQWFDIKPMGLLIDFSQ